MKGAAVSVDARGAALLGSDPRPGVLYGIGAGPGDPSLVTVRAALLLGRLDVVAVPRSTRGGEVAGSSVAPWVDPARVVVLRTPMPSDRAAIRAGWLGRVAPLIDALERGRTVGFAVDGDPSLYSTFAHAAAAVLSLRPQTEIAVVPGVASPCAAAATEARPLAVGDERVAILPASRVDDEALRAAVATSDTVVLLKAGGAMTRIRALLEGPAQGWSVRYARRIGLVGERHADSLEAADGDYMALVILRRPTTPAPPARTTPSATEAAR